MTITVEWDNAEKTTLRYEYVGKWTWDEYQAAVGRAHSLARSVDYTVDVIGDFSKAPLMPDMALSKFKFSWQTSPVQFGSVALVTNSAFVERLASTFQRLNSGYAGKFKVFRSLDDARKFITAQQTSKRPQ